MLAGSEGSSTMMTTLHDSRTKAHMHVLDGKSGRSSLPKSFQGSICQSDCSFNAFVDSINS